MIVERFGAQVDDSLIYYLSGPMSGYPDLNYPAFEQAFYSLSLGGLKVVSPHFVTHSPDAAFGDYLADDLKDALAKGCRGIILLEGWPQSRGARVELTLALALDWPVLYFGKVERHRGRRLINMNKFNYLEGDASA